MWKDFVGRDFNRDEFAAYVAGLLWKGWKPQGITLHNTALPTLAMWAESGPKHDARIRNLQSFYEGRGWHAGPHLFISRTKITVFSALTSPGVHSRCFNSTHIGIEMVGDYATEEFHSGDGAMVRDNAVFAMATLYRALGLSPADLTFHRDCKQDNHACPGSKVDKSDMIGRISALMFGGTLPARPQGAPPAAVISEVSVLALQTRLASLGFYKGSLDGDRGPMTDRALQDFAISELTKQKGITHA